jgi:GNAT superfamily N-acetyltransferase
MSCTLREATDRTAVRRALRWPDSLHGADPAWVPPLAAVVERRTSAERARGDSVLYTVERGGELQGTISVLRDRDYDAAKGERVAWFGTFDAVDDPEVVQALVGAALERARSWGATELRGPRGPTRFEDTGITVDGFDRPPPFLCRHHPPSYLRLLEAEGFAAHHDVLAYDIATVQEDGSPRPLPDVLQRKSDAFAEQGFTVRAARRRSMRADLLDAHQVLNAAFQTVPDIPPMPRSAFVRFGLPYFLLTDPRLLQIAHLDGRPVGFAACFPELNEALVAARGHLLPLGGLRAALALRRVRTASFKLLGVVPELRGTGLNARIIAAVVEGVRAAGYTRLEASVIDERNGPMRAIVEGAGMTIYRRYRVLTRGTA